MAGATGKRKGQKRNVRVGQGSMLHWEIKAVGRCHVSAAWNVYINSMGN